MSLGFPAAEASPHCRNSAYAERSNGCTQAIHDLRHDIEWGKREKKRGGGGETWLRLAIFKLKLINQRAFRW